MNRFSVVSLFRFSAAAWALNLVAPLLWAAVAAPAGALAPDEQALAFFEKNVRPVLVGRCYLCHSADTKNAGGLRVDDLNGLLTGGEAGPAVIPGDAENSLLLKRTRDKNPQRVMPQEGEHVTDEEYAALAKWINDGAAWPRERVPENLGVLPEKILKLKETHWAWQPLREVPVPAVQDEAWSSHPVDRFISATLEANALPPVGDAPPEIALRRLYYDLTGLPPSPKELQDFAQNPSAEAWQATVDRLLDSRAYAEKWARHWLDVARKERTCGEGSCKRLNEPETARVKSDLGQNRASWEN